MHNFPINKILFDTFTKSRAFSFKINRFGHSFSKNQQQGFSKDHETIFVRHAHSFFNDACQNYRIEHNLQYDWDKLVTHAGFAKSVAFNPQYIDSPLTQKGVQQCYLTSKNINIDDFDVIMVSPHNRALQTCRNLIKYSKTNFNKPIIVEPMISGSLWSSCDISNSIKQKIQNFKTFDFSRLQKASDLWFIGNLKKQDKQLMYEQIEKRKLISFQDKQKLILELIQQKHIDQDRQILRERPWKIKKMMKKIKQSHEKMLLISHYYIIQYVNTKFFNEDDHSPMHEVDLKNCFPYYNRLQEMLNYK